MENTAAVTEDVSETVAGAVAGAVGGAVGGAVEEAVMSVEVVVDFCPSVGLAVSDIIVLWKGCTSLVAVITAGASVEP